MPKPTDRLKSLLAPKPIRVQADSRGYPVAVRSDRSSEWVRVAGIIDRWRDLDSWWRPEELGGEIHREYYRAELANGRIVDVFEDLIAGGWFYQPTSERLAKPEPVDVWVDRWESGTGAGIGHEKVTRA